MKMDAPANLADFENGVATLTSPSVAFADSVSTPTAGAYVVADHVTNGRPLLPKDETSFFQIALIAGVLWVAFKFAR